LAVAVKLSGVGRQRSGGLVAALVDGELRDVPLFVGVPSNRLRLLRAHTPVCFADGDVISAEGDAADSFFVVLHGRVVISSEGEHLITRGPGDIVGEQAFIGGGQRTATMTAQGLVKALQVSHAIYDELLSVPAFARNLARLLSRKLSESTVERRIRFRNERLLFAEFGAHVAPAVRDLLISRGEDYGKPRRLDAVVLFADIRGFTSKASSLTPGALADALTDYFDAIVDVIHGQSGLVDKFVGDAVMAVWGFDPSDGSIAVKAFECAKEMVAVARRHRLAGKPIEIGIGLNAGQVFMGNVGSKGKRQFTVLGPTVNLASRFEAATKELDAAVVMGEAVAARLPAEAVSGLHRHTRFRIRHARPQTVFTWQQAASKGRSKR
jgi:class 3 adenylate cyclase